ncbi:MAG: GGDEF domain-containing protein [Alphaproteobacteria bacterium]|nr:GGDEF domain-containing protein [Alphaproteobacteria bacterium]
MSDIAKQVVEMMQEYGAAGLPRNYELFYEAATGTNKDLYKGLTKLGTSPKQEDLDNLGRQFFAHHHGDEVMEEAQGKIAVQVTEVLSLLRKEQVSLQKYGKVLGNTSVKMSSPAARDRKLLDQIVNMLSRETNSTIDHGKEVVTSMSQTSVEIHNIQNELDRYKKLANTDPLTKLANRRAFDSHIAHIGDDKKKDMYFALMFADVDHFKRINDTHGHIVGDKILAYVAKMIQSALPAGSFVARIGGEEFAIAVDDTTKEEAGQMAEDIRSAVEKGQFINRKSGVNYGPVTLSLGICMAADASDSSDIYRKTDQALYASKNSGRNRITHFSDIPAGTGKAFKDWLLYRKK